MSGYFGQLPFGGYPLTTAPASVGHALTFRVHLDAGIAATGTAVQGTNALIAAQSSNALMVSRLTDALLARRNTDATTFRLKVSP